MIFEGGVATYRSVFTKFVSSSFIVSDRSDDQMFHKDRGTDGNG